MDFLLRNFSCANQACQLAWAGGFLDGEGCIHVAKTSRSGRQHTYRLRLAVSQNCIETLWHLQSILGIPGGLHRIVRRAEHNKQCYVLVYDGRQARDAIQAVLPHLVRKRAEAQTALEFYEEGRVEWRPGRNGCPEELWRTREKFYRKLRALK